MEQKVRIKNKRASFEFFLVEKLIAGIVLTGTEIKSIRQGKANITDAYCVFANNELVIKNMHISEYSHGTHYNHDPKADRILLLQARELKKWLGKVKEKGYTIVPTLLFINESGLAKLEIALARGKHHYDKRDNLRIKDQKRDIEREIKY